MDENLLSVIGNPIWCSVLMHMVNNSISVLQTAVFDKFPEDTATAVWMAMEGLLFFVGLVCIIFLVVKYSKGERAKKAAELGFSREIEPRYAIRGFLNPTICAFAGYSLLNALLVVVVV